MPARGSGAAISAICASSERPTRSARSSGAHDVDRVIVAFSNDGHEHTLELVRSLEQHDVQIDIVPRLFEAVGAKVDVHALEGLPLLGLPAGRISRSSRLLKRSLRRRRRVAPARR